MRYVKIGEFRCLYVETRRGVVPRSRQKSNSSVMLSTSVLSYELLSRSSLLMFNLSRNVSVELSRRSNVKVCVSGCRRCKLS